MASSIEVLVPDIGGFKDVERHRRPGQGRPADRQRNAADHARNRKGGDGRAGTRGRADPEVKVKAATRCREGSLILLLEAPQRREPAPAGRGRAAARAALPRPPRPPAPARGRRNADLPRLPQPLPPAERATARRRRRRDRRGPIDETAFSQGLCESLGAQVRARAGRRSRPGRRHGAKGRITQEDVKANVKQPHGGAAPPARRFRRCRKCRRSISRKFGAVEFKPLIAHPADLRRAPAGELAQSAARHAARRGRHHGSRGDPRALKDKAAQEGVRADAARIHHQGLRAGAARNSRASTHRSMRRARIWFSRSTSTSASPPTRRTAWSCR